MRLIKKIHFDKTTYWQDPETKEEWGLVIGALAWPTAKSKAYYVIGGVGHTEDVELGGFKITVLHDGEGKDLDHLFLQAVNLQAEHLIDEFYTDTERKIYMESFYNFDQNRRGKGYGSIRSLQPAPSSGEHDSQVFFTNLIKRYTRQGRGRLLSFYKGSKLPRILENISLDSITEEIPPLLALGYCLAVLSEWRPQDPDKPRNVSRAKMSFSIFDDDDKESRNENRQAKQDFDLF